jgi:hypothetical protein
VLRHRSFSRMCLGVDTFTGPALVRCTLCRLESARQVKFSAAPIPSSPPSTAPVSETSLNARSVGIDPAGSATLPGAFFFVRIATSLSHGRYILRPVLKNLGGERKYLGKSAAARVPNSFQNCPILDCNPFRAWLTHNYSRQVSVSRVLRGESRRQAS